ncbi:MAG: hypothetical protein KKA65_03635 [Nanoarchaeota archaeon]|nr:hypothetical protein [Nanoarchaeota archaeon]MBU4241665.1 hypothetical protein [Nanoarchaeota archaeon]MBU4352281.1 hypothetical protein [Nanoarchaeota archaeon]MBU4456569.1 hypothetical protein [Nanoarchaeota archaeon]MCG2719786.1 hypothetical protein [Nanoarchaeota archaeon]
MEYTKREISYLAIVTLVLTFVFAFNDNRDVFVLSYWITNFIKVFVLVGISVFIHDFAHDLAAKRYGFISEYRIWGVKKFGLSGKDKYPKIINFFGKKIKMNAFPIGIIIALFLTLISNGKLFFTAISSYGLMIKKSHRIGRKFIEVTDFEEAKIALAGPMANILLAIILSIFNSSGIFSTLILINSMMPVFDMIPFPGLDGSKVFWGSKPLFIFSFLFILSSAILLKYLSAIPALFLALIFAIMFLIIYLFQSFK